MVKFFSKLLRMFFIGTIVVVSIPINVFAAKAEVTDVSGRTYQVASVKLQKGKTLDVACGDMLMRIPFKGVSGMKIDQAQIEPVGGRPHFGVEIRMRKDGAVIGNIEERGRCMICADNGLRGKSSGAAYSVPFGNLSSVQILGKGDDVKKSGDDDEDDDEEE